jgi:CheY-like chemotaxis protein
VELVLEESEPIHAMCGYGRVQQALLNLVANAMDAAQAGRGQDAQVHVRVNREERHVVFSVQDNGPGVPASVRNKIFKPFFTTKGASGTGLGLYLSWTFAQAHGGDIQLVDTGPAGSTFHFRLPITEEAPEESEIRMRPRALEQARPKVLVIDDEPAVVRSMKRWLRSRADVVGLTDPVQALDEAKAGAFTLILCDYHMPGLNGLDLRKALLQARPDMASSFVVMTGSSSALPKRVRAVRKPLAQECLDELLEDAAERALLKAR